MSINSLPTQRRMAPLPSSPFAASGDAVGPAPNTPAVLLLTELFPPDVGGSPVLFEAVYSRLKDTTVTVLTDSKITARPVAVQRAGGLAVVRRPIATTRWGVLGAKSLSHHMRVAWEARKLGSRGDVVVHCGRALPEGVAAWLSRRVGGPAYLCWAHGEDIATAHQSREFTWLMTRVYGNAAANIANSQSTARMLEALGMPADRTHVIYPGVDVHRFRPQTEAPDIRARFAEDGRVILLSVGRLQRRKGHDLAIEAVSRLPPSVPVSYLIVGDGAERGRLEALVAQHRLQDRVHFLGEVPARDLPRYYAACDIFLLPNRIDDGDVEGFGIVFLEAAATGRPTIGGRSGGVPEAVLDRETGMLVSGNDAGELAAVIEELASSKEKRHTMGAAGRERVCRAFTWERAAADVLAVHVDAASRERRARHK
jgi:phosphatidylinositol alpha-1,6-mannosyltransferase